MLLPPRSVEAEQRRLIRQVACKAGYTDASLLKQMEAIHQFDIGLRYDFDLFNLRRVGAPSRTRALPYVLSIDDGLGRAISKPPQPEFRH